MLTGVVTGNLTGKMTKIKMHSLSLLKLFATRLADLDTYWEDSGEGE